MSANLLITGHLGGTNVSGSFFRACKKHGIPAEFFDISPASSKYKIINYIHWNFFDRRYPRMADLNRALVNHSFKENPLLVTTGLTPIEASTLKHLKKKGVYCVNFMTDDPWNVSHRSKWAFEALKEYQVVFTPRRANIEDLKSLGGPRVTYLPFGYDEDLFRAVDGAGESTEKYDVFFAGGADKDRVPLLHSLISAGLDVRLYGDYWKRFAQTRSNYYGYAQAAQVCEGFAQARLSLVLVRRANRDGHVMRTYEAAACKGCLLVEDTPEHREIYGPTTDSVAYFSSDREMLEKAKFLLERPQLRSKMREAAFRRIVAEGQNTYTARIRTIIQESDQYRVA